MDRTDAILVAQIIKTMYTLAKKLEEAYEKKDFERFEALKKELLTLQRRIDILT